MNNLLRKLFLVKEIKSKDGELHFRRYRIFWTPWIALYIHRIFKADEDEHMHSHPWDLYSIILWGGYKQNRVYTNTPNPQTVRWVTAIQTHDYHRVIELLKPTCTTLALTVWGNFSPNWGYLVNGVHIDHIAYRKFKNAGLLNKIDWTTNYEELLEDAKHE